MYEVFENNFGGTRVINEYNQETNYVFTKAVQSDSGAIGGSVSHEYMVLTDTAVGENDVFYFLSSRQYLHLYEIAFLANSVPDIPAH